MYTGFCKGGWGGYYMGHMRLEEANFVYVSLCVMVCVCSISYEHQSVDICCPLLAGEAQHARLPGVFFPSWEAQ